MPPPRADIESKAAALASRLRLVQSDFADDAPETRRMMLQDEIERAAQHVEPQDREAFLAAVGERFPAWDANVPLAVERPEAAPARSAADERELRDPSFLVARLVELAPSMPESDRRAAAERLRGVGLSLPGEAELPEAPARALREALGHTPAHRLDPARTLELAALLAGFAVSLDQVAWRTWREVAPASKIRRAGVAKTLLARFAAGDPDIGRAQVKDDVERLSALTAALIGAVSLAGESFSQRLVNVFLPANIKDAVAKEPGGAFTSAETRCWRKYAELAEGSMNKASLEAELMRAVGEAAERLMQGVAR